MKLHEFNWRRFWAIVGEGIHPDAPRPADVRHDGRHPDDPAHPVRLRHQFRSEASAHGGLFGGQQRFFAHDCLGVAQQQLFRHHARGEERGGNPKAARARHGAIRRGHSGGFFAQTAARRKTGFAARSRRHRSVGRRLRHRRHQSADDHRAGPRPHRAAGEIARQRRRRSTWSCISITIPKTSRNTTSCPASWA